VTITVEDRQILVTMEEAAECLRIGRTSMYALVMAGEVDSVRIGRSRRVPVGALHDYVRRLRECQRIDAARSLA
jgi:excisionase family DNA binding protein